MVDGTTKVLENCPAQEIRNVPSMDEKESFSRDSTDENELVDFIRPRDPENPKDWSVTRKWAITCVLAATGFNRILVSTIMAPTLPAIAMDLGMDRVESLMSMSVYLLATAVGPLAIAPLSEVYGRKPILHATNLWFLVWNVACGFAKSKEFLTTARLLAGLGAGAAYMLAGSVLGDVWDPEQRGRSLGLSSIIQNLSAAIGPILGAFITENTKWQWIFWSTSLFQVVIMIVSVLIYSETYTPLILQRKAERLRKETGDSQMFSASEKQVEDRSAQWILRRSLSRPLRLLVLHPTVTIQAVLCGFTYGILYLVITTYTDLWTVQYGESLSISGLHYIAMSVGSVLGAEVCGRLMDFFFRKLKAKANGSWKPEFHLPTMFPGAILTIIGLLWYGWAAQKRAYWLNVDVGSAVLSFGMQMISMPLQGYIIDVYPEHASSAQAAAQVLRSLCAFGFPLFAPNMYSSLGYGWGNTILAFVAFAICLPAPVLIWLYGARLRSMAKTSF